MQAADVDVIDRTARRRASMKMGWIIHALVYAAVNTLLVAIAASAGRQWAVFPVLGWGIGLAAHGVAVFFASGGGGLYDSLLRRERERLQAQRDPW